MTLYQFKLLDQTDQLLAMCEDATYLAEHQDGDYTYKLYQLDAFYIEEQWHTKFAVRASYTAFISHDKLTPYLNNIDVSLVLKPPKR